jgi:competence protein ComEC
VSYVSLVGGDVPVLRAAIMGIIGAIALHGSKRIDTLRVLLFAAIVLLIFSPYSLVYDAGFQLSFLATLGILVGIRATKRADWFLQATVLSIFAALWTIPVSIGIFQNFSPWSILANILV